MKHGAECGEHERSQWPTPLGGTTAVDWELGGRHPCWLHPPSLGLLSFVEEVESGHGSNDTNPPVLIKIYYFFNKYYFLFAV